MATRFISRSLIAAVSRSFSPAAAVPHPSSLPFRLRPLFAASAICFRRLAPAASARGFATRQTSSTLSDPNPNWSNRPPKETILLDGCDFEHWLVVMEKPEGDPTRDEIIDSYIKTLAMVVGSEEEARMKLYSVSTRHYFAFGALVSEELSYKIKELPRVRWVLPDSYLDVRTKDYGGEPFINGQAVPYDPKYHEEWVRNNARANERNRRNDRPRNFDRSRNFERRREGQNSGPGGNMSGPPPGSNMSGPPPGSNMGGPPPGSNMGGAPHNAPNSGPMHPNMGPQPGYVPSNPGNYPANNMRGPPPNNSPNYQYGPGPNQGPGFPPGQAQNQNAYTPNMRGGNPYQNQNVSGRDMPMPPNPNPNSFNQNRGYAQGQQSDGYAPNVGYGGQTQNNFVPNAGPGPGQNQNYGPNPSQNQNVPGRDYPPTQNY